MGASILCKNVNNLSKFLLRMMFKAYTRCIYTSATIWSTKQPLGVTHSADDNFYSILNVKRTANQSEIKEAYEVLSDKSKKQSYDQFLDKLIRSRKYLPRK